MPHRASPNASPPRLTDAQRHNARGGASQFHKPRAHQMQRSASPQLGAAEHDCQRRLPTTSQYYGAYRPPSHDAVTAHYLHAPAPPWAHPSAYQWQPPPPPPQQQGQEQTQREQKHSASLHHRHPANATYEYAPAVPHVAMGPPPPQYVQQPVWTAVHPHRTQYAASVPVQLHEAHYAHFYPPPPPPTHMVHYPPTPRRPVKKSGATKLEGQAKSAASQGEVEAKTRENAENTNAQPQDAVAAERSNAESSNSSTVREKQGEEGSKAGEKTDERRRQAATCEQSSKQNGVAHSSATDDAVASNKTASKEAEQPIRKSRKPYTITKNRESWSDNEHRLFLQALQLYNRDWKRIEQYIGSKTVKQIRSHAQKHFGKVTKYKTGEYIPPPRPKRRASRPYPRSRNTASSAPTKAKEHEQPKTTTTTMQGTEGNTTTTTSGSGMASDSGAGSSDNGHVSANGKCVWRESSDNRRHPRHRSVDRASATFPVSVEQGDETERNGDEANSERKSNGANGRAAPPQAAAPLLTAVAAPGAVPCSYDTYFYNIGPPNGLPYANGFYHNNHYPPHHRQPPHPTPALYACYDPNCNDYNAYHKHSLAHGAPPHLVQQESGGRNEQHRQHALALGASDRNQPDPRIYTQANNIYASRRDDGMQAEKKSACAPLMVLSQCVDMMGESGAQSPSVPWRDSAASRRAYRLRILRQRKYGAQKRVHPHTPAPPATAVHDGSGSGAVTQAAAVDEKQQVEKDGTVDTTDGTTTAEASKGGTDILVGPPDGGADASTTTTPVIDVDEAVAGFSGSDGQGSMSDGAQIGGSGAQDCSETAEEDPNSSNDGSGDDGRTTIATRGSSPADPNSGASAGSREDTPPCGRDESHNVSAASRDCETRATSGDEVLGAAATVLTKYCTISRKVGIDNLLNASASVQHQKKKRGRSSPERNHLERFDGNGGQRKSLRRKHSPPQQQP